MKGKTLQLLASIAAYLVAAVLWFALLAWRRMQHDRDSEKLVRYQLKASEARLLAETALTDKIIDSLPGMFYVTDTKGTVVRFNRAFETLLGYKAEDLSVTDPFTIFAPEDRQRAIDSVRQVFKEGYARGEVSFITAAGERKPFSLTGTRIETPDGPLLVGMGLDISEQVESLQRSNSEILAAYERTIEGWSRALDLRDEETEGHSRRVTEHTVRLAERFGIPEAQLVHIRRGALLHDIGKMGVPDHVLLKPGPLTGAEWELMKRHPEFAYQLLLPIEFLRPALDIPYSHHERWDGSGYPHGLKGEDIPFSARIFAVVDVYDALTSDRPYRPAWGKGRALTYLRDNAGVLFDAGVVEEFERMMSEERQTRSEPLVAVEP